VNPSDPKLIRASQPPPAPWIEKVMADLRVKYPEDRFEAVMRWYAWHTLLDKSVQQPNLPPVDGPIPSHLRFEWQPRIRCQDCTGKVYTVGPGQTLDNFLVHLKNRAHREVVERRIKRGG